MKFVEIAKAETVPAGSMKSFAISAKEILVVNLGGKFYAVGGRCTHANGDLSKGTLEGSNVICPRHGSKFDVTTGSRLAGPAKNNLPVYEIKVENQVLMLKI